MVNVTNGNPPYWKDKYANGKPPKSGHSTAIKVGCSILAVLVVLSIAVLAMILLNKEKPDETARMIEELRLDERPPVDLTTLNMDEVLHEGMPKDSVLMLLGKPTVYRYKAWSDDIIYEYGDSSSVQIWFDDNKVSGYDYHP